MPSTYTSRLRLELPATGEQAGTWGNTANANFGQFIEEAICGIAGVDVTAGDYTLSVSSPGGTAEEARRAILGISGTPGAARNVIIPAAQKTYIVNNLTAQPVTVKTAAAAGLVVPAGTTQFLYCDGTNVAPCGLGYSASGATTLAALAVTGAVSVGGFLTGNGGAALTAAGVIIPLTITAPSGAVAADLRGRSADNLCILRFLSNNGATEYARLQGQSGGFNLVTNGGTKTVLTGDMNGDAAFGKSLTIATGLTISAGGAVVAGNTTVAGDVTSYRPSAPLTGAMYLGNSGARYLYWDGANYSLGGAGTVWHTGNFSPGNYAALSGADFSGPVRTTNARFISQNNGGGDASVCCYIPGYASSGLLLGPSNTLHLCYMDAFGNYSANRAYIDPSNNFVAVGNVSAYSDVRLKTDLRPLEEPEDLLRGLAAAVIRYRWRKSETRNHLREELGVSAQGVQRVVPEAVLEGEDGVLSVSDRPMVAVLLATVARLLDRIEALEAKG